MSSIIITLKGIIEDEGNLKFWWGDESDMSRKNGVMSDNLKYELARELGVDDIVAREGWGGVSSRNCGNLVKLAIERAEKSVQKEHGSRP